MSCRPAANDEYSDEDAGPVWMQRLLDTWPPVIWRDSEPQPLSGCRHSIEPIHTIVNSRVFPPTLAGLERAMRELHK